MLNSPVGINISKLVFHIVKALLQKHVARFFIYNNNAAIGSFTLMNIRHFNRELVGVYFDQGIFCDSPFY